MLQRRLVFFICFLSALFMLWPGLSASARAGTLSAKVLSQVVLTVQKKYVEDVSLDQLISAARAEMIEYLKGHGVESPRIEPAATGRSDQEKLRGLVEFYQYLLARYDPDATGLLYSGIRGTLKSLNDPSSYFMTPGQFRKLNAAFVVPDFYPAEPADESDAGYDEEPVTGYHGPPPLPFSVRLLEGNIGYIRIGLFDRNTGAEVRNAMQDLIRRGVQGYVLDLRNNAGGFVEAAVEVTSCYLKQGSPVVSLQFRQQSRHDYQSRYNPFPRLPLVVLVNEYSAGAPLIIAGAVQEQSAGTIIGARTANGGSISNIFPLPDGSAISLTLGYFVTPKGRNLHKEGILPDLQVKMDYHQVGNDVDQQLTAALEFLAAKITATK